MYQVEDVCNLGMSISVIALVNCQVVRNAQAAGIPCAGALRRVEVCSQHFCPGADLGFCWNLWLWGAGC